MNASTYKGYIMRLFILLLLVTLTSCALPPTKEDLAAADYGTPIVESDAKLIAKKFLDKRLKDPESAVIEWKNYKKSWMREGLIHGGGTRYGYVLNASIKAKNSYGAYIGYKQYIFILRNNKVVSAYAEETQHGAYGSTTALSKIY